MRIRRYALNIEGGSGAGQYRGGFGAIRDYEILADDAFVYGSMGRSVTPPWGMDGGGKGSTNYLQVRTNGQANWRGARVSATDVGRGQVFSIVTGGGGGYGDPRSRPPEAVVSDVADGYIDAVTARSEYGVVIGPDGALDADATAEARRP